MSMTTGRRYEKKPPLAQEGRAGALARWRMRREDRRAMREAQAVGRSIVAAETDAEREAQRTALDDRKMFLRRD